jgi:GTPase SAR1 family protein
MDDGGEFRSEPMCIVFGLSGSGKTALLDKYKELLGVDRDSVLAFPSRKGGLVDMRVCEMNEDNIQAFRNGLVFLQGDAYVGVYSISNRHSFKFVETYLTALKRKQKKCKLKFIVVANKSDEERKREVVDEEGVELARRFGESFFFRTSALNDANIRELFSKAADVVNDSPDPRLQGGCCTVC